VALTLVSGVVVIRAMRRPSPTPVTVRAGSEGRGVVTVPKRACPKD